MLSEAWQNVAKVSQAEASQIRIHVHRSAYLIQVSWCPCRAMKRTVFRKVPAQAKPPSSPISMLCDLLGVASRQQKRFFSTLTQNTPVGPNIEIRGAGGSMYLCDSRLIRRFFLYLDTEWTMLCYENLTSVFKKAVSSCASRLDLIVKSCARMMGL